MISKRGLTAAGAISAIMMLLLTGTAHAARYTLPDSRGYGYNSGSYYVVACDTRADGWGVRTWYTMANGVRDHVGDANGSQNGCGGESTSLPVVSITVCAGPDGENRVCRP